MDNAGDRVKIRPIKIKVAEAAFDLPRNGGTVLSIERAKAGRAAFLDKLSADPVRRKAAR